MAADNAICGKSRTVPKQWRKMGVPDNLAAMEELLAGQCKANFAKLKTWEGAYSFTLVQVIRGTSTYAFGDRVSAKDGRPLAQQIDGTMHFVLDVASKSTNRAMSTTSMKFHRVGSTEEVGASQIPPDQRRARS